MKEQVFEHNPGDHEDPVAGPTWVMGITGSILVVVIYFGLTALFQSELGLDAQEKARAAEEVVGIDGLPLARELKRQQLDRLGQAKHWETDEVPDEEDRKRWVVPIEESIPLAIKALRADQARAARGAVDSPDLQQAPKKTGS